VSLRAGKHVVTVVPKVQGGVSASGDPVLVDGAPVEVPGTLHGPAASALAASGGGLAVTRQATFYGRGDWPGSAYAMVTGPGGVVYRQDGPAAVFGVGAGTRHYEVGLVEAEWAGA
jgi:hypothetical protein